MYKMFFSLNIFEKIYVRYVVTKAISLFITRLTGYLQ